MWSDWSGISVLVGNLPSGRKIGGEGIQMLEVIIQREY